MNNGDIIKAARKHNNMTQKQLADKTGIAEITIRQYEAGKYKPKMENLKKIAKALNVSLFQFLDDDLFDAATEPPNASDALNEGELIDSKLKFINENESIPPEEKEKLLQNLFTQTQISKNFHEENTAAAGKYLLNNFFDMLNLDGQEKAIEQVEMLTKIPEYKKSDQ